MDFPIRQTRDGREAENVSPLFSLILQVVVPCILGRKAHEDVNGCVSGEVGPSSDGAWAGFMYNPANDVLAVCITKANGEAEKPFVIEGLIDMVAVTVMSAAVSGPPNHLPNVPNPGVGFSGDSPKGPDGFLGFSNLN